MSRVVRLILPAISAITLTACVSLFGEARLVNGHRVVDRPAHNFSKEAHTEFLVLGDWGSGTRHQMNIAERMNEKAARDGAKFVLTLGDNFYDFGVSGVDDKQFLTKWKQVYVGSALQIPFYVCLGNHDHRGDAEAQIEYSKKDPLWRMPAHEFTFSEPVSTKSRIEFFALDTTPLAGNKRSELDRQLHWLDSALTVSTAEWKIVFGHHTLYSNGQHGNTTSLVKELKPILEKHHVQAYFCGHDHDTQVLKPTNGVHYIVCGGGGGSPRDVTWGENTEFAQAKYGFVWCAVSDSLFEVQCFNEEGTLTFVRDFARSED
jgi:tartrate-resistant acid phosphatase type 5